MPELVCRQPVGQASRAYDLNSIRIYFHEHIGAFEEPVPVHDSVGDRFAHCLHRVLRNILAPEAFDPVCGSGIAFDEFQGLFYVGRQAAVEILSVEDMDLIPPFRQQACDIRIREKSSNIFREEQYACIAEQQRIACPFGSFYIDQHVLDGRSVAYA